MKKLFVMVAVLSAAMLAQADLYLYWNLDEATLGTKNYAALYYASNAETSSGTKLAGVTSEIGYIPTQATKISDVGGYQSLFYYIVMGTDSSLNNATYSAILNYEALNSMGVIGTDPNTASTSIKSWSGAVPEPTSGLLLLVGAAMLALKRRRV